LFDWIGYRFAHDFHPSLLVNRVQNMSWMENQDDALNYMDASTEDPTKVVPPHHLISGAEGKMYPGFTGYDFNTIPINNVFKDSLNYILEVERIGDDPHGPEYCVYYNNFRPDAAEHRITKIEWKTVRAPQLTLTSRGWAYEGSYEGSQAVEYEYPYDGSKTDTWFVILSIQYQAIIVPPYNILKYRTCICNSSSSSSSSASPSSSSSSPPCVPTGVDYWTGGYTMSFDVGSTGDCSGDTLSYIPTGPSFLWSEPGVTCETGFYAIPPGKWFADPYIIGSAMWVYCVDNCHSGPTSIPSPSRMANSEAYYTYITHSFSIGSIDGRYNCTTGQKSQTLTNTYDWWIPGTSAPGNWFVSFQDANICYYDRNVGTVYPKPDMNCNFPLNDCNCYNPPSSSSASPFSSSSASPSSSSSSGGFAPASPPPIPTPIEDLFFADLSSDGYLSPYMGRPFESIDSTTAYKIGFFNKMLYVPIQPLEFTQGDGVTEYVEDLISTPNSMYDRVLHFYMTSGGDGSYRYGPYYVPYVDSVTADGNKSKFTLKPLREVINPRLQKIEDEVYIMYFFSNFTEEVLEYTDDPTKMKRMFEFATNFPSDLFASGSQPSSNTRRPPEDNTLNYFDNEAEIITPKCALCSCVVRVTDFEITTSQGSSSSSASEKIKIKYPIAEKPTIVNWVGDRFSSDFVQPLLLNTTQSIDWSSNKQETDTLDNDAINADPKRQIEYYGIIDSLEAKMYPGYTGLNLGVRPIVDIYGDSLYHVFVVDNGGTDKYFLEVVPSNIFASPANIMSYEWEHSGKPTELNEPGLGVEDDPSEDTPSSKTDTHYIVMRLKLTSSESASKDYCDKL